MKTAGAASRVEVMALDETRSNDGIELKLETQPDGKVAQLTVDRRRRLNVLSSDLLDHLLAGLETLAADPELRVVTLTGAGGRAFIGGADIEEMADLDAARAELFIRRIHAVCLRLRTLSVPVVAKVEGFCLGAGLEVALSCDLRLASEESRFGVPEVRVGVPTVIDGALLKHFIGAGRARDLALTGRMIDAREALAWGLVDRVVPASDLERAHSALLEELLEAAPGALRRQKELCRVWEEAPLTAAVEAGVAAFVDSYESSEPSTYMRRFLNRRR